MIPYHVVIFGAIVMIALISGAAIYQFSDENGGYSSSTEQKSATAVWEGAVIAKAPVKDIVSVEGNAYFPEESVNKEYLVPSNTHTTCHWKGEASYHTLKVNGKENKDAVWFYPSPSPGAEIVKGRVAFWKGVKISGVAAS